MYVSVLRHDTLTYFWAAGHPSPSSERVVADEDTQVGQQLPLASGRGRPDRAGAGDRGTNQSCRACRSATTHRGPGSRPRRSRAGSAGRPRWWQEALRGVRGSRRCWTGRRGGHRDHCRSDDCAESGEQATAEVLERIEPRHGALLDCEGFSPWFGAAAAGMGHRGDVEDVPLHERARCGSTARRRRGGEPGSDCVAAAAGRSEPMCPGCRLGFLGGGGWGLVG
jgi:hypothetical protein